MREAKSGEGTHVYALPGNSARVTTDDGGVGQGERPETIVCYCLEDAAPAIKKERSDRSG